MERFDNSIVYGKNSITKTSRSIDLDLLVFENIIDLKQYTLYLNLWYF